MLLTSLFIAVLFYFCMYRNNLVWDYRTNCLFECMEEYNKLPSYMEMVFNVVNWPRKKLKSKSIKEQA